MPGSIQALDGTAAGHGRRPIDAASIRIAPLGRADADAVAALRGDVVREGLLARLGGDAGRAYFRVAAADPDTFGFVTSDEAGIAGFVLVTSAPRRLERRTVARHPRIWLRTAAVGLRSPSLVTSGIRRLRSTGRPSVPVGAEADPALRLLDIAVARRAQGHGHGRMLLAAGLEEAWRRGYEAIGLSVLDENRDAIRLYERAGFRRTGGGLRADGRAFQVMRLDRPMARPARETARTEAALPAGAERVAD